MKVFYANCTAHVPHTGCLAVTDSQIRALFRAGCELTFIAYGDEILRFWTGRRATSVPALLESQIGKKLEECDVVVVNGEGTIHHGRGLHLLCLLAAAQHMGKRTFLVNAIMQDTDGFDDVLRALNDLNVRDRCSAEYLERKGIPHRLVPDSIVDAQFADKPDVNLEGCVICTDWHFSQDRVVGKVIWDYYQTHANCWFYPLYHGYEVFRWRHAVANFRQAQVVITGRHHGMYLAGLAGVPFVSLQSNSHKVEGLIKLSGLPLPLCRKAQDMEKALAFARKNANLFREFQHFLISQRPLSTLDKLAEPVSASSNVEDKVEAFFCSVRADYLMRPWIYNPYNRSFFRSRRLRKKLVPMLTCPLRWITRWFQE